MVPAAVDVGVTGSAGLLRCFGRGGERRGGCPGGPHFRRFPSSVLSCFLPASLVLAAADGRTPAWVSDMFPPLSIVPGGFSDPVYASRLLALWPVRVSYGTSTLLTFPRSARSMVFLIVGTLAFISRQLVFVRTIRAILFFLCFAGVPFSRLS